MLDFAQPVTRCLVIYLGYLGRFWLKILSETG